MLSSQTLIVGKFQDLSVCFVNNVKIVPLIELLPTVLQTLC